MKATITLFFFTISFLGFSQDDIEWFQPGQEWYYNVYCFQDYACGYTHYQVGQTEMIGSKEATILNCSYIDEIVDTPILTNEYFRFESDTMWRYSTLAEEWHMLWDMGAEVGEVWTIQNEAFYGYGDDGSEPGEIQLFKVIVDSVALWEVVPNSNLTDRRVIYTSPVMNEAEESQFSFGPILEGVGPINQSFNLIGNSVEVLLTIQAPSFQCFLENGNLVFGSLESPCHTLSTNNIEVIEEAMIYPNPASNIIFWDAPIQSLTIYDIQGRIVLQNVQTVNSQFISIQKLHNGVYTAVIERDGSLYSQKLIIER